MYKSSQSTLTFCLTACPSNGTFFERMGEIKTMVRLSVMHMHVNFVQNGIMSNLLNWWTLTGQHFGQGCHRNIFHRSLFLGWLPLFYHMHIISVYIKPMKLLPTTPFSKMGETFSPSEKSLNYCIVCLVEYDIDIHIHSKFI